MLLKPFGAWLFFLWILPEKSALNMDDLKAIVDFLNLESLLIIAEELKLKGLTSDNESSVAIKKQSRPMIQLKTGPVLTSLY